MFCGKCGAHLNDTANFCNMCGERVAQFRVVDKTNLSQQVLPASTAAQQGKGRKTATAALILGIISIVLSLVFAPFIYSIFANLSIPFTTEDWILSILTICLNLVFKMLLALFEGLASAIFFHIAVRSAAHHGLCNGDRHSRQIQGEKTQQACDICKSRGGLASAYCAWDLYRYEFSVALNRKKSAEGK